jgi:hypothetical protein
VALELKIIVSELIKLSITIYNTEDKIIESNNYYNDSYNLLFDWDFVMPCSNFKVNKIKY